MLNNKSIKYKENIETPENLNLEYESRETENKFRFEHKLNFPKSFSFSYGVAYEYVRYTNSTKLNTKSFCYAHCPEGVVRFQIQ